MVTIINNKKDKKNKRISKSQMKNISRFHYCNIKGFCPTKDNIEKLNISIFNIHKYSYNGKHFKNQQEKYGNLTTPTPTPTTKITKEFTPQKGNLKI